VSWYQLLDILAENRQNYEDWRNTPPVACPIDGAILETGVNGDLNCPAGNYRYPRDGHPADRRNGP